MQILRYSIGNNECCTARFAWLVFVQSSSLTSSMDKFQVFNSYRNPIKYLNLPPTCRRKHWRSNKNNTLYRRDCAHLILFSLLSLYYHTLKSDFVLTWQQRLQEAWTNFTQSAILICYYIPSSLSRYFNTKTWVSTTFSYQKLSRKFVAVQFRTTLPGCKYVKKKKKKYSVTFSTSYR